MGIEGGEGRFVGTKLHFGHLKFGVLSCQKVGLVSLGCWFQPGSLQCTEFRCVKSES